MNIGFNAQIDGKNRSHCAERRIQAKAAIIDYMVGYYSQVRSHTAAGGLTPSESEDRFWRVHKAMAKNA